MDKFQGTWDDKDELRIQDDLRRLRPPQKPEPAPERAIEPRKESEAAQEDGV